MGAGSASSGSGKSVTSLACCSVTSRLARTAGRHSGSKGRCSARAAASMKSSIGAFDFDVFDLIALDFGSDFGLVALDLGLAATVLRGGNFRFAALRARALADFLAIPTSRMCNLSDECGMRNSSQKLARIVRLGRDQHAVGRTLLDDATGAHHDHAVA